ncbi:hypothetical protein pipiens_001241 [Culex pipiens pipiens]|uniref:Uncharacterized protein n=1 Tax=Culex pipiens pipiens TaxID=38569 RepID=A0ABD1D963_CULPP
MNISSVPVNEIKTLKRATILDLSNNVISIINTDFTSLIQLTKIDLKAARKAVAFMADIEQQVIEDRRKERELREKFLYS